MQVIVVLTSDTDCDGTSFGAHKITVPDEMYSVNDHEAILKYAHTTEQMSRYEDVVEDVMHIDRFLAEYPMSPEHTDRFHRLNYTSRHRNPVWNPWAGPDGDDTIGIPALDSRYDD